MPSKIKFFPKVFKLINSKVFLNFLLVDERFLIRNGCGSSYLAESGSGNGSSLLLSPDPIRIQAKIFYDKIENIYIRKIVLVKNRYIGTVLNPYKGRSVSSNMIFLPFSGENFGLPRSGFPNRIRTRWPK
jgi:hypothetical protein